LPIRNVVFTAAACDDVIEAQNWCAGRSAQLGRRFRHALDRAVFGITQNPRGFPIVWRDRVRRALVLDRFPYALYFTVDDDQITVIACFHASRDPRRWQERT
jgi:plasmid stabilization system protein ParE